MNNTYKTQTKIWDGKRVKVVEPMKEHDVDRKNVNTNTSNSRYLSDYPDVLTPTECMNILSISRNAIYSLLQNDFIKSV